jgi:hypothetical protein
MDAAARVGVADPSLWRVTLISLKSQNPQIALDQSGFPPPSPKPPIPGRWIWKWKYDLSPAARPVDCAPLPKMPNARVYQERKWSVTMRFCIWVQDESIACDVQSAQAGAVPLYRAQQWQYR